MNCAARSASQMPLQPSVAKYKLTVNIFKLETRGWKPRLATEGGCGWAESGRRCRCRQGHYVNHTTATRWRAQSSPCHPTHIHSPTTLACYPPSSYLRCGNNKQEKDAEQTKAKQSRGCVGVVASSTMIMPRSCCCCCGRMQLLSSHHHHHQLVCRSVP